MGYNAPEPLGDGMSRPRVASESPDNEAKRARNALESVILGQRDLAPHQNHPTMRQSELATR